MPTGLTIEIISEKLILAEQYLAELVNQEGLNVQSNLTISEDLKADIFWLYNLTQALSFRLSRDILDDTTITLYEQMERRVGIGSSTYITFDPNYKDISRPVSIQINTGAGDLSLYALDSAVVHKGLTETITGLKTFTQSPIIPDATTIHQPVSLGQLNNTLALETLANKDAMVFDGYALSLADVNFHQSPGMVVTASNGDIYAVYRKGASHVDITGDVYIRKSIDNGITWQTPYLVYSTTNIDDINIAGGLTDDGRMVIWFRRYDMITFDVGYIYSTNSTYTTWSGFNVVTPTLSSVPYGPMVKNGQGEYLQTLYGTGTGTLFKSTDGITWTEKCVMWNNIALGAARNTTEAAIAYTKQGKLIAQVRDEVKGGTFQYNSTDNGATWNFQGYTNFGSRYYAGPQIYYDSVRNVLISMIAYRPARQEAGGLNIFVNTPEEVFDTPTAYAKQKIYDRPLPNFRDFYGYPVITKRADGNYLVLFTESYTPMDVLPIPDNEKGYIYQFTIKYSPTNFNQNIPSEYDINNYGFNSLNGRFEVTPENTGFAVAPDGTRIARTSVNTEIPTTLKALSLKIGSGTQGLTLGNVGVNSAIWFNGITPINNNNYSFQANATTTWLNAATTLNLSITNVSKFSIANTIANLGVPLAIKSLDSLAATNIFTVTSSNSAVSMGFGYRDIRALSTNESINIHGNGTGNVNINNTEAGNVTLAVGGGKVGIGLSTITAYLHLKAGTAAATTAPLKFTSGPLMTTAEAGANEFLTDKYYATITTGAARKEYTLNDVALNSGIVPITTTNGRLTNSAVTSTELALLSGKTSVGTVTNVSSANTDIGVATGTSTPVLTLNRNAFPFSSFAALATGDILQYNGTNWTNSVNTVSAPLVKSAGNTSIPAASTSVNGYLTSTDWNTFNNKLSTVIAASTYVPYTGATATVNLGSQALTTNGNIGAGNGNFSGSVITVGGVYVGLTTSTDCSLYFQTGYSASAEYKWRFNANGVTGGNDDLKLFYGTYPGTQRVTITPSGRIESAGFKVSALNAAPSSSTDTGVLGDIRITAGYIYVCVATNTWVRAALTTF